MSRVGLSMIGQLSAILTIILATCAGISMTCASDICGQEPSKPANPQEKKFMNEVSGEFDVKLVPVDIGDEKLGMMTIDKQYHGDLTATGKGRMLTGMTEVKDSGVYVAVERVSGKLKGAEGTFLVHHTGIMHKGAHSLTIRIVPDSGTGALAGIDGVMHIKIENKKHFYRLEYTLGAGKEVSGQDK